MQHTQIERVKNHLQSGWSITPIQALNKYGCFRLAAIIHRLRTEYNMNIKTVQTSNGTGKFYATYRLNQTINIS